MMDAAREFGFKEGFVVPFHYRDRLGSIHSSSTVFFWEDEPSWFQKLFSAHRHELHLIMIYWVQRAMDVVNRDQRSAPTIFGPSDDTATVQLTAREKEVMAWAARGKTVADTAQILGLSPETIEGFIKQALRKLDASNKTHGVAKSIALGIIDL
jgi:DNA-binding CsgD family transcriptional regulator